MLLPGQVELWIFLPTHSLSLWAASCLDGAPSLFTVGLPPTCIGSTLLPGGVSRPTHKDMDTHGGCFVSAQGMCVSCHWLPDPANRDSYSFPWPRESELQPNFPSRKDLFSFSSSLPILVPKWSFCIPAGWPSLIHTAPVLKWTLRKWFWCLIYTGWKQHNNLLLSTKLICVIFLSVFD